MPNQVLTPFDLSLVMEQIGSYLDIHSLVSCSLVSRTWYSNFAPFIWWYILDDCDTLLFNIQNRHKIAFDKVLKNDFTTDVKSKSKIPNDPHFHLETEYVNTVSAFVKKVDGSSRAFHKQLRTHLNNRSYASFIIMGWLCDDIRHIDFIFTRPHQFGASHNTPDMYKLSSEFYDSQLRCDRVIEIVEKSRNLESLQIDGHSVVFRSASPIYIDDHIYRWLKLNNPSTPITPRWHYLTNVIVRDCQVDQEFIKILLLNSPLIIDLELKRVRILSKTGNTALNLDSIFETKHPPIKRLLLEMVSGVTTGELARFVSMLPDLEELCVYNGNLPLQEIHSTHNFPNLRQLNIGEIAHQSSGAAVASFIRSSPRLENLRLAKVYLTAVVFRAIRGLANTLIELNILQCMSDGSDGDGIHRILASCRNLKAFRCIN
ncbi:hypothetical protein BGZ76_000688, partial [Entomortierella beljakovae]